MNDPSVETADPSRPSLAHFPLAFFALAMGLSGLGLTWQLASLDFGLPRWIGIGLSLFAGGVFVIGLATYLLKLIWYPAAVLADYKHPLRLNFLPAISITLMLSGGALLSGGLAQIGEAVWLTGAIMQFGLAVLVISRWIERSMDVALVNPSWFVPIVGNALAPVTGVRLGYDELSWLLFGVAVVFWLLLFAIVLYRMFFHQPISQRLLPTLFIMLAPPSLCFNGWVALNGGVLDAPSRILASVVLFLALVLIVLGRNFTHIRFGPGWWAYTFPSAAAALTGLRYFELSGSLASLVVAVTVLGLATLIIAIVTLRTAKAAFTGELFKPEAG